jgi:hypothetical protein
MSLRLTIFISILGSAYGSSEGNLTRVVLADLPRC